mgnify:FL=1
MRNTSADPDDYLAATSGDNLFSVHSNIGGSSDARFIITAAGDYYFDGAAQTAFDDYADAELIRAFDQHRTPDTVIRSRWDEHVRYNKKDLVDAGILGHVSPEDEAAGNHGLVNGAQLQRLHNGAIWQLHCMLQETREELKDAQQKLMRLEAA